MGSRALAAALAAGVTLSAQRTDAQIAVTSNAVVQHAAERGQRYEGTLVIRNASDVARKTRITQTDYAFTADGRSSFDPPGKAARSNARWISFGANTVVVPAGGTTSVSYTVTVPDSAGLSGTYWSLLMVEQVDSAAAAPRRTAAAPGAIDLQVTTRYATQVATHVGSAGSPRVVIDSVRSAALANGHRTLRFDFANTGERASPLTLTAELFDDAGRLVARQTQARGLLYPGSSARQSFDVGPIASGSYRVVISADAGSEAVFGGTFRVRF